MEPMRIMGRNINEYAALAMNQARKAADSGTFGVGGVLLDLDGNIICAIHNQVIKGNRTNDPTAHGERQIVDWYLANKEKENLPEPENCILITTLDPCVMCTGALAQVKFNKVIVVAIDDYAGINWESNDECHALDGIECQKYVKEHFVYPEVTSEMARKAFGADLSDLSLFSDVALTTDILKGCRDAFSQTADEVRGKVSSAAINPDAVKNPADLDTDHPIRRYMAEFFGRDFLACSWKPGAPAEAFMQYVEKEYPGFLGVAYFDAFGNLLYLAGDDETISTQSAFMKLTRKIAAARNTEPIEGYEINEFLHHPRYGYFVYMNCPEISEKTIMELGAIGSTLENASENPIYYVSGEENEDSLKDTIKRMPPLYQMINIRFEQIPTDDD